MDKLPKDMVIKLTEELSPQDFINFCASNTSSNVVRICDMPELWIKRFNRDFSYIIKEFPKIFDAAKQGYLELFTRISKMAEIFTEIVLKEYGKMRDFLKPEFPSFLYKQFYKLCVDVLQNVLQKSVHDRKEVEEVGEEEEEEEWISESVRDTYYNNTVTLFDYFPGTRDNINSRYEFQEKWEDEIESPLRSFVKEILVFLEEI